MADIPTIDDLKRLLENFKTEIVEEIILKMKSGTITNKTKWLRSKDVRQMLNISDGSLRNMRNGGIFKYQKIRGMYFYNEHDIRRMMESPNKL